MFGIMWIHNTTHSKIDLKFAISARMSAHRTAAIYDERTKNHDFSFQFCQFDFGELWLSTLCQPYIYTDMCDMTHGCCKPYWTRASWMLSFVYYFMFAMFMAPILFIRFFLLRKLNVTVCVCVYHCIYIHMCVCVYLKFLESLALKSRS